MPSEKSYTTEIEKNKSKNWISEVISQLLVIVQNLTNRQREKFQLYFLSCQCIFLNDIRRNLRRKKHEIWRFWFWLVFWMYFPERWFFCDSPFSIRNLILYNIPIIVCLLKIVGLRRNLKILKRWPFWLDFKNKPFKMVALRGSLYSGVNWKY